MNRNELINMIETGTTHVRNFLRECESSASAPGTHDNWNNKDAVGHIIGWMNYSIDKLTCIKLGTKQSDEYSQVTSLGEINLILYDKSKNKNIEQVESEYIKAMGDYFGVISLYSNDDLNKDTFETGFKMELWRYMLMDTVIHPLQHVLYQDLKANEFGKLKSVLVSTKEIFERYSANNGGYALSEFEVDRDEYQKKLGVIQKEFSDCQEMTEFVKANIKGNS